MTIDRRLLQVEPCGACDEDGHMPPYVDGAMFLCPVCEVVWKPYDEDGETYFDVVQGPPKPVPWWKKFWRRVTAEPDYKR